MWLKGVRHNMGGQLQKKGGGDGETPWVAGGTSGATVP